MINISEMMYDPDFTQVFTVLRNSGSWQNGRWIEQETEIKMQGVITVAGDMDLQMLPEADRLSGVIAVRVAPPYMLYTTQDTHKHKGTSDIIIWRCVKYNVTKILPEDDWGYRKALCTLL